MIEPYALKLETKLFIEIMLNKFLADWPTQVSRNLSEELTKRVQTSFSHTMLNGFDERYLDQRDRGRISLTCQEFSKIMNSEFSSALTEFINGVMSDSLNKPWSACRADISSSTTVRDFRDAAFFVDLMANVKQEPWLVGVDDVAGVKRALNYEKI